MSSRLSEQFVVLGTIDPATVAVGNADTDWIDMSHFERVLFVVMTGILGAGSTINFQVQEASTPGGATNDLTGKSITTLAQASGGSAKQAIVEVSASDMSDDKRYLRGRLSVGTAASPASVIVLGGQARFAPAHSRDLDSVVEIVA